MHVSIIIPAVNEAETIARAVTTAWQAGAAEVIVADGGSSDETYEIAAANNARLVQSARGRAIQQNAGAASATGDVLLFQHADNYCGAASVEQIREVFTNENVVSGAFRQRILADGLAYRLLERGNALRVTCGGMAYGDQGIFVRRNVFRQLGGFPAVPLMEDLLLMRQLRKISRPVLLPGPHYISPRRWQRHGVLRQTLRNWTILTRHALGASPEQLAASYARHDRDRVRRCENSTSIPGERRPPGL